MEQAEFSIPNNLVGVANSPVLSPDMAGVKCLEIEKCFRNFVVERQVQSSAYENLKLFAYFLREVGWNETFRIPDKIGGAELS